MFYNNFINMNNFEVNQDRKRFDNDSMEDIVTLGIIFTSDCYIILKKMSVIDGIDRYIHSSSSLQTAVVLVCLFISAILLYIVVDKFYKKNIGYKLCSFVFGAYIITIGYIMSVVTGCTVGIDDKIVLMEYWNFVKLFGLQLFYFCLIKVYVEIKNNICTK